MATLEEIQAVKDRIGRLNPAYLESVPDAQLGQIIDLIHLQEKKYQQAAKLAVDESRYLQHWHSIYYHRPHTTTHVRIADVYLRESSSSLSGWKIFQVQALDEQQQPVWTEVSGPALDTLLKPLEKQLTAKENHEKLEKRAGKDCRELFFETNKLFLSECNAALLASRALAICKTPQSVINQTLLLSKKTAVPQTFPEDTLYIQATGESKFPLEAFWFKGAERCSCKFPYANFSDVSVLPDQDPSIVAVRQRVNAHKALALPEARALDDPALVDDEFTCLGDTAIPYVIDHTLAILAKAAKVQAGVVQANGLDTLAEPNVYLDRLRQLNTETVKFTTNYNDLKSMSMWALGSWFYKNEDAKINTLSAQLNARLGPSHKTADAKIIAQWEYSNAEIATLNQERGLLWRNMGWKTYAQRCLEAHRQQLRKLFPDVIANNDARNEWDWDDDEDNGKGPDKAILPSATLVDSSSTSFVGALAIAVKDIYDDVVGGNSKTNKAIAKALDLTIANVNRCEILVLSSIHDEVPLQQVELFYDDPENPTQLPEKTRDRDFDLPPVVLSEQEEGARYAKLSPDWQRFETDRRALHAQVLESQRIEQQRRARLTKPELEAEEYGREATLNEQIAKGNALLDAAIKEASIRRQLNAATCNFTTNYDDLKSTSMWALGSWLYKNEDAKIKTISAQLNDHQGPSHKTAKDGIIVQWEYSNAEIATLNRKRGLLWRNMGWKTYAQRCLEAHRRQLCELFPDVIASNDAHVDILPLLIVNGSCAPSTLKSLVSSDSLASSEADSTSSNTTDSPSSPDTPNAKVESFKRVYTALRIGQTSPFKVKSNFLIELEQIPVAEQERVILDKANDEPNSRTATALKLAEQYSPCRPNAAPMSSTNLIQGIHRTALEKSMWGFSRHPTSIFEKDCLTALCQKPGSNRTRDIRRALFGA